MSARNSTNAFWPLSKKRRVRRFFAAGDMHRDARRWREAASAYASGLELKSDAYAIWVQLGHVLKEAGEFQEAEAAYERALAGLADDGDLQVQLGHLNVTLDRQGRASTFYERAVALGSTDLHALEALAADARSRGDWARCALWLEKAVAAHAEAGGTWVQYGHALKESGQLRRAESAYLQAIKCDHALDDVYLQLGHLYAVMNDHNKAAGYYALAYKHGSRDEHALRHADAEGATIHVGITDPELLKVLAKLLPADIDPDALREIGDRCASFADLILQSLQHVSTARKHENAAPV